MALYLKDIPLPDAQHAFEVALREAGLASVLGKEEIPLNEHAIGRILAGPVWAKISSPHYHSSAMDGFAVHSSETIGAQPKAPLMLTIGKQATYIDTGDPLPSGFDAVIPIENTDALTITGNLASDIRNPQSIRIRAAVTPWSHVRPLGEDVVATQLVFPTGHMLRPVDLGAIAASGHTELVVSRKPRVAVIPTGDELVPIGADLKPGDILEYNSLILAAQVNSWGGSADRFPPTPDDPAALIAQITAAARDHDLILLNAGSSAGADDYSSRIIEKMGSLLVHGVAVRPGHPVILGLIRRANMDLVTAGETGNLTMIPIIGIPGYPVSAALTGEIFVEPLLARWTGRKKYTGQHISAKLTRKITSPAGDDDFIRIALGKVGDQMLAAPLARGAGVITSLSRADGLLILPRGVQGAEAGEIVDIRLQQNPDEMERTIFCVGSHDLTLDLLAQALSMRERRFISSNVGSIGGLIALSRGDAHLAGTHLLDTENEEFNISYLAQYLPGMSVSLITLVGREQGLLVRQGNPLRLKDLSDLPWRKTGRHVQYINRQRGAGTRVLLDHHLGKLGIDPNLIQGYNQEEFTHLGVAAAVASGRADCGLGIAAAAQALELDFIPLFLERYDLAIPKEHAESELVAPLFEVIQGTDFKEAVKKLPGYDVGMMGKIILEA